MFIETKSTNSTVSTVISKNTSKCALIISDLLKTSIDSIIRMALKVDFLSFNTLSLIKIKDIIRHLRATYIECRHLSLSLNKPQLIHSIENIIIAEINGKLVLTEIFNDLSFNSSSNIVDPNHNLPINSNEKVIFPTSYPPPFKILNSESAVSKINNITPNTYVSSSSSTTCQANTNPTSTNSAKSQLNSCHNSNSIKISNSNNYVANIPNKTTSSSVQDNYSNKKEQIYRDLINYEGITKEEIRAEISLLFTETNNIGSSNFHLINSDMVLLNIIEKRQPPDEINAAERERRLLEQENQDLDYAIRESEKEREVIQERKRQRVYELKESKTSLFADTSEYKNSILLSAETLPSHLSNECSVTVANSQEQQVSPTSYLIRYISQSRKCSLERDILYCGSSLLQFLVSMLDCNVNASTEKCTITKSSQSSNISNNNEHTMKLISTINNDTDLIQWTVPAVTGDYSTSTLLHEVDILRSNVTNLLLLENEARKYYPKMSVPYLFLSAKRIDMKLIKYTLQDALTNIYTFSKLTKAVVPNPNRNHIYQLNFQNKSIFINHNAIIDVLERERVRLQRGLYKLPEDGRLIPAIFRSTKVSYLTTTLQATYGQDIDEVEVVVDPAVRMIKNSTTTAANDMSQPTSNITASRYVDGIEMTCYSSETSSQQYPSDDCSDFDSDDD